MVFNRIFLFESAFFHFATNVCTISLTSKKYTDYFISKTNLTHNNISYAT